MSENKINYSDVLRKYPWIVEKNQDCILSPDSDGLLCGLFMSHYLNWKIRGFYDGKILLIQKGFTMSDCIFLDMEIFRENVQSVGQHMIMFNRDKLPVNWSGFNNAISANNLRNFDVKHNFKEKYPFGTIHLLMAIIGQVIPLKISKDAICPILYTDGVFKNLFNYPENCLSWLKFFGADNKKHPLNLIFFNDHYSISQLMMALRNLFAEFSKINNGKRGGDKIKISNRQGQLVNLDNNIFKIETKTQTEQLLLILSQKTGWKYNSKNWTWGDYDIYQFKKGSIKPGLARYNSLVEKKPLSLAVISGDSIEYTLEN